MMSIYPEIDPKIAELARRITADRDRLIKKALRRAARSIAFRLLLRQPILEFECFLLKLRYAMLRIRRYLAS